MANVVFKRGSAVEIAAVPVTDGYILWDTTNNIMYMDNGQKRLIFGVGGTDGIRPVEFGGTGGSTPADAALALLVDSLDASPRHVTANTDLDNYTAAGVYSCATNSIAATVANNPWTTGTFTLIVRYIESSNTLLQWLVGCCENQSDGCGWFFRACVNGTFFPWQTVNTGKISFDGVNGETLAHTDETGALVASNTLNADLNINGTVTAKNVIGAQFANLQDVVVCDEMPDSVVAGKWYAVKSEAETMVTGTVQLPVHTDDIYLQSRWECNYIWSDDGYFNDQTTPTVATVTKTFNFDIPADATVTSAKVHSHWSGSLYGAEYRKVAGQNVGTGESFVTVDIPEAGATSIDVSFAFKALTDDYRSHYDQSNPENNVEGEFTKEHYSGATLTDVYLLLEYTIDSSVATSILTPYNLYRA